MSPHRVPLIAGNWKMHGTRSEAAALADGIKASVAGLAGREVLVAPPYTALETVARVLSGGTVLLAASVAEQAFGDLRAPIVRVAGKNTVIPFNLALERASVPQVEDIVAGVRSVI